MPEAYVLDTHALFWYLTGQDRLGANAREIIDRRAAPDVQVFVSAITIAELFYLNEKVGRPLVFERAVEALVSGGFELADFEAGDVSLFCAPRRHPRDARPHHSGSRLEAKGHARDKGRATREMRQPSRCLVA